MPACNVWSARSGAAAALMVVGYALCLLEIRLWRTALSVLRSPGPGVKFRMGMSRPERRTIECAWRPRAAEGRGRPTPRVTEHGSANQFVSGSAGFLAFPARRHQSIGPEASHLARTVRHQGGRLTLSFSGGSAACGAHDSIGPAHPHAHKRVLFQPGITHSLLLWIVDVSV